MFSFRSLVIVVVVSSSLPCIARIYLFFPLFQFQVYLALLHYYSCAQLLLLPQVATCLVLPCLALLVASHPFPTVGNLTHSLSLSSLLFPSLCAPPFFFFLSSLSADQFFCTHSCGCFSKERKRHSAFIAASLSTSFVLVQCHYYLVNQRQFQP